MPVQYLETVVNTGSFKSENTIDDDNEISLTVQSGTAALKFQDGLPGFDVKDSNKSGFFKLPTGDYNKEGGILATQADLENMEFKFGKGIESHDISIDTAKFVDIGVIKWSQPLDNVYEKPPVIQLFKEDGSLVLSATKWDANSQSGVQVVNFWITTSETEIKDGSYKCTCFGKTDIAGDTVETYTNEKLKYNADIGGVEWVQNLSGLYKSIPIVQIALSDGTITSADIKYADRKVTCIIATEGTDVERGTYIMTAYGK